LFQIAIAEQHNILNVAVKKILDVVQTFGLNTTVKFAFVVPSSVYAKMDKTAEICWNTWCCFESG
jgi:hypothetical protein